jgi:hypothetical protein
MIRANQILSVQSAFYSPCPGKSRRLLRYFRTASNRRFDFRSEACSRMYASASCGGPSRRYSSALSLAACARALAPELGADNALIYGELGLSAADLRELTEAGVL